MPLTAEEMEQLKKLLAKSQEPTQKKDDKKPEPKVKEEKQTVLLEIVSVGKAVSTHILKRLRPSEVEKIDLKVLDVDLTLTQDDLYLYPKRFKGPGIKHRFIAFIDEQTKKAFKFDVPPISADGLFIVKNSSSLSRALSEMFKAEFQGKKWIFIVVAGVVTVVVGYILYQQWIHGALGHF